MSSLAICSNFFPRFFGYSVFIAVIISFILLSIMLSFHFFLFFVHVVNDRTGSMKFYFDCDEWGGRVVSANFFFFRNEEECCCANRIVDVFG